MRVRLVACRLRGPASFPFGPRRSAPAAKILFASQESSSEVVREALTLGLGYVHKSHFHSDLLLAVEAVLAGKRFVSPNLAAHEEHRNVARHDHEMLFYSSEAVLMASLARFVAKALAWLIHQRRES